MERNTRVTIKDVANVARVAPQTVSRALRNTPDVSPETRERILKIAAELNYVKNYTATSLRNGATRLIAVIYDNLINLYFSIMSDFLQSSLRDRGYSVLTMAMRQERLNADAYLAAVSHNVDGIVSFIEPDDEISALVEKYGVPVLLFGRRTDLANVDDIHADDRQGGRIAASRLIERGCRRLVCLTEPLTLTCAYDRFEGFREVCAAQGVAEPRMEEADEPTLEARMRALFGSETPPDGVFCFNDMLAFEMLYLFEKLGVHPVAVVGYDNVQGEIRIPQRLTSVGMDKYGIAERAAQMIVSRIKSGPEAPRVTQTFPVFLSEGTTA